MNLAGQTQAGRAGAGPGAWRFAAAQAHYRTWRAHRVREIERRYGDRLADIAEVLGHFAADIAALGPTGYLRAAAHREGELVDLDPEQSEA